MTELLSSTQNKENNMILKNIFKSVFAIYIEHSMLIYVGLCLLRLFYHMNDVIQQILQK